jgi:NADH-quinone oxidoreductase subunit L
MSLAPLHTGAPVIDPAAASGSSGTMLVLVIALPALGAAVLLLGGRRTDKWGHWLGVATVAASFVLGLVLFFSLLGKDEGDRQLSQNLWTWFTAGQYKVELGLLYDQLSAVFVLLITGVGGIIHLYSVGYMEHDDRRRRFFGYLNLFVASMLMLVLASDFVGVFLGWEGVGLASYLLIGFWQHKPSAAAAAKKAFVINRVGDIGLSLGSALIFVTFGSTSFAVVSAKADGASDATLTAIGLLLLLAACGKSAQFPLQTWLLDAMEGPTPVSALIHAATMVTAGVYLIARSSFLFSHAPVAQLVVVLIGALTAIFAASIGLKQWDIKKVLAYSTVSQLGYMFVGVGSGAYVAGVFHLVTHAFFKALLFLGSGSVIYAMHAAYHHTDNHDDAQDMRNMGGLRQYMPITFVLMWIATLAIAGIPPLSGFFSKDEILGALFARAEHSTLASASLFGVAGSVWLYIAWALGLAAAFMTATYMTRMMLYTFHGPNRTGDAERSHLHEAPWVMTGPLVVLGVLAAFGGWLNLPEFAPLGKIGILDHWLEPVVGESTKLVVAGAPEASPSLEYGLVGLAVLIAVAGIALAVMRLKPAALVPKREAPQEEGFEKVLLNKYYVDEIYDDAVVKPVVGISRGVLWRGVDAGLIDGLGVNGSAYLTRFVGWVGSQLQSGQLGTYAWVLALGVLAVLGAFGIR